MAIEMEGERVKLRGSTGSSLRRVSMTEFSRERPSARSRQRCVKFCAESLYVNVVGNFSNAVPRVLLDPPLVPDREMLKLSSTD